SVNTHDLPPTAGYLAGDHVTLRHQLGLLERPLAEEHEADAAGREEVLDLLRTEGLLTEDADIEQTVIALHRHLARTPSLLLGVSLVDCVGERRIQNQPGTDEEYANWRIPLADAELATVSIDDIATDERTARLLAAVREGISRRSPGATASVRRGRRGRRSSRPRECDGLPIRTGSRWRPAPPRPRAGRAGSLPAPVRSRPRRGHRPAARRIRCGSPSGTRPARRRSGCACARPSCARGSGPPRSPGARCWAG